MDQSPAPSEERRFLGNLGPKMTAFVVADGVLVLAFVVVLALYLSGGLRGEAAGSTPSAATSGTAGETSAAPTPDVAIGRASCRERV